MRRGGELLARVGGEPAGSALTGRVGQRVAGNHADSDR